jgi:hypothetical protein
MVSGFLLRPMLVRYQSSAPISQLGPVGDRYFSVHTQTVRVAVLGEYVMVWFAGGDAHTSPFAGLGHRLITWLPTRQSRFDSGGPLHYKHPWSIGKDICFSHR